MSNKIVAVSLFSGGGGLDIASCMAGVPVISSTDFDADCIKTLKANEEYFGKTEIFEGDLHEIESDVFKDIVKRNNPDKFIIIGGAPCQPFSKNGYWVTNQVRRGINDPRATLVNEYLRVVTDLQPDGFLFENVESLLHPTNKVIVDKFIEIIEECGYKYKIVKANALDYGVPQKRKRLFILGTKGNFKSGEPKKTHGNPNTCEEDGLLPYVNAGEAIAGYDGPEYFEEYETVNEIIVRKNPMASTEDKRLGTYFIKAQDLSVGSKNFPEKVIKYLWDDAVKFKRDIIFNDKDYPTLENVIEHFENSSMDDRLKIFADGLFKIQKTNISANVVVDEELEDTEN